MLDNLPRRRSVCRGRGVPSRPGSGTHGVCGREGFFMIVRRFALVAVAAAALLMLATGGGPAAEVPPAPDGISPTPVNVTLGKGSSTTVESTLHLATLPGAADILLAFDTTGSMGAAITDASNDAEALISQLQASIPHAKFAVGEFKDYGDTLSGVNAVSGLPWRVAQDFTDNSGSGSCEGQTPIKCALGSLSATGGGDEPEAYNTAFYEAFSDSQLHWDAGAARFMIVLGDSLPHDSTLHTDFPYCPNTPPTDPGPAGVGALRSLPTLQTLHETWHTNVSFVTYNPRAWQGGPFQVATCQGALAAYTGGSGVTHATGTASLREQIVALVSQAASHVDSVTFNVVGPEASVKPTLSFNPPTLGPATAPADLPYTLTVNVPNGTPTGTYDYTVHANVDGSDRAQQQVHVTVSDTTVSGL